MLSNFDPKSERRDFSSNSSSAMLLNPFAAAVVDGEDVFTLLTLHALVKTLQGFGSFWHIQNAHVFRENVGGLMGF